MYAGFTALADGRDTSVRCAKCGRVMRDVPRLVPAGAMVCAECADRDRERLGQPAPRSLGWWPLVWRGYRLERASAAMETMADELDRLRDRAGDLGFLV